MQRLYNALLMLWGLCLVLGYSVEGRAASLATPSITSHPWYFSPDGLGLYFSSDLGGRYDLYSVRRAGSETT